MSTLAVIPARIGATRLPQKPLRLLGGLPLVLRVWEHVSAMRVADRVLVATDSDEVIAVCRRAGAEAVMTRSDHLSGTDRIAEVIAMREFETFNNIVNVQGDEPEVAEEAVRGALQLVSRGRFPIGTAGAEDSPAILGEPNVVKVVADDSYKALYFSRAPIPFLRDSGDAATRDGLIRRHVGVYAYTRDALEEWVALPPHPLEIVERLEQLRPLMAGMPIGVAPIGRVKAGGIDTEHDLELANARWSEHSHL